MEWSSLRILGSLDTPISCPILWKLYDNALGFVRNLLVTKLPNLMTVYFLISEVGSSAIGHICSGMVSTLIAVSLKV